MSIQHYCVDQNKRLPVYCSTVNNVFQDSYNNIFFAPVTLADTKTNEIVVGFYYDGNALNIPASVKVVLHYVSGVVGTLSVSIKNAALSTTYYTLTASVPVSPPQDYLLTLLTGGTALPTTPQMLYLVYTTSADFNWTCSLRTLLLNY